MELGEVQSGAHPPAPTSVRGLGLLQGRLVLFQEPYQVPSSERFLDAFPEINLGRNLRMRTKNSRFAETLS